MANLAQTAPAGTYFVLNRSWRTALGPNNGPNGKKNVDTGTTAANQRPDILIVEPLNETKTLWKVSAIEVQSGTQKLPDLEQALRNAYATINNKSTITKGTLKAVTQEEIQASQFPTITW